VALVVADLLDRIDAVRRAFGVSVFVMVSSALIIRLSLQPSPASETSAFNKIRAFTSRWAWLFPFRISASSCSRSSALNRTTYFFTCFKNHLLLMALSTGRDPESK